MVDALPPAAPAGAEALGPAEPCRTGRPSRRRHAVRLALQAGLAMRAQAASQAEGLSAHLAAEGLLFSVVPLVSQKVRDPPEGPATLEMLKGKATAHPTPGSRAARSDYSVSTGKGPPLPGGGNRHLHRLAARQEKIHTTCLISSLPSN